MIGWQDWIGHLRMCGVRGSCGINRQSIAIPQTLFHRLGVVGLDEGGIQQMEPQFRALQSGMFGM